MVSLAWIIAAASIVTSVVAGPPRRPELTDQGDEVHWEENG